MIRILPSKYRYPLFFAGLLIMEMAGLLFKFIHLSMGGVEALVISGFIIFVFSLAAT